MRRVRPAEDGGSAIIEFVFVAVGVLLPLVYLIVAVAVVQRARLATTSAARDVGRAIGSAGSTDQAERRAKAALQIALANQGLTPDDVQLRYVAAGADCLRAAEVSPVLVAGAEFQVCVIRHQRLPAVPAVLSGRGITTIGRYVVHLDDYRTLR